MIEIINQEDLILKEISDKRFRQNDVARSYALILRQDTDVDWSKINRTIIDRWSLSGLEKIKESAWTGKCFERRGRDD